MFESSTTAVAALENGAEQQLFKNALDQSSLRTALR